MCSGIRFICKDGSIIVARTLEFGIPIKSTPYRTEEIIGTTGNIEGNIENTKYFMDGMNRHGLCVMAFYFSDYADYIDINDINNNDSEKNDNNDNNDKKYMSSVEMVGFLLRNCRNIDDILSLSQNIRITRKTYEGLGIALPLHWFCVDHTGKTVVIECVNGIPILYNNPYGVIANSPPFPEHVKGWKQMKSSFAFSADGNNEKSIAIQGQPKSYSLGTGLLGLPGDFTSISRFIRLATFQEMVATPECVHSGQQTAFHILNNFDIVKGMVRDENEPTNYYDYTQYTICYSYNNRQKGAFIKTYDNQNIRSL